MTRADIQSIAQNDDYLKKKLFCRGFLVTDDLSIKTDTYPFYSEWRHYRLLGYSIIAHPLSQVYLLEKKGIAVGLIGHAYNPTTGETNEVSILNELASSFKNRISFFNIINQLTGVFALFIAEGKKLTVLCDAVGLQPIFYCQYNEKCYFSSHTNLIGDLLNLSEDPTVTRLKKCKTFHYFGNQLPGNITQFKDVKRINPNHYASYTDRITQTRFYYPHYRDLAVDDICENLIDLLQRSMQMIPQKWNRPAISLTGGCDSKTTLACACNVYDRYSYFSYDSQSNEQPDALAASRVSQALGLPFTLYKVPYNDDFFPNIESCRAALLWNGGSIRANNANDVRKRLFFDGLNDFDIEVKSWVSEIGRARYTKRYNGKKFFGEKPTPRKCTTFYKFLLFDRKAVHISDSFFQSYLNRYFERDGERPIPWQDQFYWEWHWPSRDGLNLASEQRYAFDITVPYNNRIILELLLSVPEEMRINDTLYTMIRKKLDNRIDAVTNAVVDVNHTKMRAALEATYYYVNTLLPF